MLKERQIGFILQLIGGVLFLVAGVLINLSYGSLEAILACAWFLSSGIDQVANFLALTFSILIIVTGILVILGAYIGHKFGPSKQKIVSYLIGIGLLLCLVFIVSQIIGYSVMAIDLGMPLDMVEVFVFNPGLLVIIIAIVFVFISFFYKGSEE